MKVMIGSTELSVVKGDISTMEADVLVNAANDSLWMGSGVAGALKARGGEGIEVEAVKQGPIAVGASVVTAAGNLTAKHVVHAAVMPAEGTATLESVGAATRSSLGKAVELSAATMAMPAFGTGAGAIEAPAAAKAMFDALIPGLLGQSTVRNVRVVINDPDVFATFDGALKGRFTRAAAPTA